MAKIIKDYVSKSQKKQRPGYAMNPKYITVHNTANPNKGANAEMHARYLHNGAGGRTVGWHFTVDDTQFIQHLPTNESGWHAGDGNGAGNRQSIGIEICENSDGDFDKAVENAQRLITKLMGKHGIPLDNVVPHKHWSGKNCPRKLLDSWDDFIAGIKGGSLASAKPTQPKPESKPKKTSARKENLTVDGKWGKDTTRALQRALGTPVDGIISRQPRNSVTQALYGGTVSFGSGNGSPMVRALQRKVGAGVDGKLGPDTVRRLQRHLGTVRDGVLSRPSMVVRELQRRLNAGTF